MDIPGWPGQSAGGFGGTIYGGGLPGDFTPWVGGGPPAGGQDPNQIPNFGLPPWVVPPNIGDLGGGRASSYPPLTGLPPAASPPTTTTNSSGPFSGPAYNPPDITNTPSSGINWSNVLSGLGKAIQGGIQGYQGPKGGGYGGSASSRSQQGGPTEGGGVTAPHMQTQAPLVSPAYMPSGSATATMPISPVGLPAGSFAPLSPLMLRSPSSVAATTRSPIAQFLGSYQQGGIVPRTGLYPVQSGQQIIPAKRVKKIAKLHKGELVVPPRYVGAFQEGGTIPPDPLQLPAGSAAPIDPTITDPDILAPPLPIYTGGPVAMAMAKMAPLAKLIAQRYGARQQGTAGGGGETAPPVQGGSVALGPRIGQPPQPVPAPQMNIVGATGGPTTGGFGGPLGGGQQISVPGVPQVPGLPMGPMPNVTPGAYGGPATYATPAALPPYQNQFAPRGRASYVTQNLLGGLSNALLQWKQQQFDKTAQQSMADAATLANAQGAAPPAGGGAPQQQGQGGGSTYQASLSRLGQLTQQGGAPPLQAQGPGGQTMTMPPPTQGQVNNPLSPAMTPVQQQTFQELQRMNPKRAEQYSKDLARQHDRAMKNFAKAQTDPSSPQYRGFMAYYQQMQQQQAAQADLEAKVYNAITQRAYAETERMKADMQQRMFDTMQGMFAQPGGIDKILEPMGGYDKLKPEQKAIWNSAKLDAAYSGDPSKIFQATKDIGDLNLRAQQVHGAPHLVPDANSPLTGLAWVSNDAYGNEVSRTQNAFSPTMAMHIGTNQQMGIDANGNPYLVTKTSTQQRVVPGMRSGTAAPGVGRPTVAPPAPGTRPTSPSPTTRTTPPAGPKVTPVLGPGGVPLQAKIPKMMVGNMPDGRQFAGTPEQLRQWGVKQADMSELPANLQGQVVQARNLTAPNGLFSLTEKDLARFKPGELNTIFSHWQEFLAGTLGQGADERYVRLRTHLNGLLSTAIMQAHVGATGRVQMMEKFQSIAEAGKMSEDTIRPALEAEREYIEERAMRPSTQQPPTGKGNSVDQLIKKYGG